MYYVLRTNRGKQVIERRDMPTKQSNPVLKLLKSIFTQENMLTVIAGIAGAAFIIQYCK